MLSGGQKQRISIARALLLNAEILILDDALSAVDGRTEHQILHNLRQWGDGRTVIISAHRLSALTEASEILVMQHGHIAQRGQHETLAEQPGWYRDMYRYQQLEAALDDAPEQMRRPLMRKLGTMWPTLKRLLAYGSPWRKPLSVAVLLLCGLRRLLK
jgi:ATP-binding cassette subfamily B multidrug efflux pump